MTFGHIKTAIEKNLLESYKNEKDFKKSLREFRANVLNNKSISKVYAIYDQLSTPQNLSESDAKEFLSEGLNVIAKVLPTIKLPKSLQESKDNDYKNIDTLVYTNNLNLKERVEAKKSILRTLMSENQKIQESIKLPVSSMVKIANQTLEHFIDSMDTESKKMFVDVVKSDSEKLKEEFSIMKESTLEKLNTLLKEESEDSLKSKLTETIEKIKTDEFSQLNYVKLVSLVKNL